MNRKIVLVGNGSVGKTSIIKRYCSKEFSQYHSVTMGVDFKERVEETEDGPMKLKVWDTAG